MHSSLSFSILGIPIDCQGESGGTEDSPKTLREAGLVNMLGFQDKGDLAVKISPNIRDPESGVIGFKSVCQTTSAIRQSVKQILACGEKVFLMGGCCTELIGALAGAKDHFGDIGLAYIDGHIDLYDGQTSPTGETADMPIAILLGYGPKPLQNILGKEPVIKSQHLALLAYRDLEEAKALGSLLPNDIDPKIMHYDIDSVRAIGTYEVGKQVVAKLVKAPGKYWLHLDFDVLDPKEFPATDYLMPNGLTWAELLPLLQPLCTNEALIGISIACYNPHKDPGFQCAKRIVSALKEAFS